MNEPVVLIGGFGSHWRDYWSFSRAIARVSGRRVFITSINRLTWLVAGFTDYYILLERAAKAVAHALDVTKASCVILVGHSAGGVVARSYLADRLSRPHRTPYNGYQRVQRIVMVGSPLHPLTETKHAGMKHAAWVDREYPGAFFAPDVQYLSVLGRLIEGRRDGTPSERRAYNSYRYVCGKGDVWGDGVVPNLMSQLDGVPCVQLEGVGHSPGWGPRWYGSDESTVRLWWDYFEQGDVPLQHTGEMLV